MLLVIAGAFAQDAAGPPENPPDANPRYFPVVVFAAGYSDGDFTARWYASQLRALVEPSLSGNPAGLETVYRFTWLRSNHHPIAVRVVIEADGTGVLKAKMTDGKGGLCGA